MATTRRNPVNAEDQHLGGDRQFTIDEIGTGAEDIEVVDSRISSNKLEHEAFMNEMITIMVHETTDPNEAIIVPVSVNGRTQNFMRGRPQVVRRCYVERLARAKKTHYSQNLQDFDAGTERVNVMRAHNALKYPFSVIEDRNPKGGEWLRNILASR